MREAGTIEVLLPDEELAARRAAWVPRQTLYQSGAIWKFAQMVGPAHLGRLRIRGARLRRIVTRIFDRGGGYAMRWKSWGEWSHSPQTPQH